VLGEVASLLRAQGRFTEALPALRAGLQMEEDAKRWDNAAIGASNLSQAELLIGEVAVAVATAETSVAHADRSGDEFFFLCNRATHADALHAAGQLGEATQTFADAESRQKQWKPTFPLLDSGQGYDYCDLLLTKGEYAAARDRAEKILDAEVEQDSLLDRALVRLALGRAHLGLVLATTGVQQPPASAYDGARTARAHLGEAVDGLRASGNNDAARDLDEVEEIAEPGPMRLFLCDMTLERARLAFAHRETFAPLNGLIDDSPPKPERPGEAERKALHDEAAKELATAADYIKTCGYHRRDEELAELQAVLRGDRTFAGLRPRV
jgi:hypothetical protein